MTHSTPLHSTPLHSTLFQQSVYSANCNKISGRYTHSSWALQRQRRQQHGAARQGKQETERKAHVSSATTQAQGRKLSIARSTTNAQILLMHTVTYSFQAHTYVAALTVIEDTVYFEQRSHDWCIWQNSPIILHCIRSHTIPKPGLYGNILYSRTLAKCLPGHCDCVHMTRLLGH